MASYRIEPILRDWLPAMTKEEYDHLSEQIKEEGCSPGSLTVADVAGEELLVDGHNTVTICKEQHRRPCEPTVLAKKFADLDEAKAWMLKHQSARRNMTVDQRREMVIKMRADGQSHRTIAETLGVSHTTVRTDLDSGGKLLPPVGKSDGKITGADGKGYEPNQDKVRLKKCIGEIHEAIEREQVTREDALSVSHFSIDHQAMALADVMAGTYKTLAEAAKYINVKEDDEIVMDHGKAKKALCPSCQRAERVGQKLPRGCKECKDLRKVSKFDGDETPEEEVEPTIDDTIKEKNSEIESFCRSIMKFVEEKMPSDEWLDDLGRKGAAIQKFKDACSTLRTAKCHAECPECKGDGCTYCHKTGRVPKMTFDQLS